MSGPEGLAGPDVLSGNLSFPVVLNCLFQVISKSCERHRTSILALGCKKECLSLANVIFAAEKPKLCF